jgi:hypothetical protein
MIRIAALCILGGFVLSVMPSVVAHPESHAGATACLCVCCHQPAYKGVSKPQEPHAISTPTTPVAFNVVPLLSRDIVFPVLHPPKAA